MVNSGRIILITGVTRGLGKAMAEAFASLGHVVLGCGRSEKEINQLKQQLGAPHDWSVLDVSNDQEVAQWAAHLLRRYPPPDLVLNNAAVINRNAPLWEVAAEEFDRVVDINIKGPANVIRHFFPAMLKRSKGVIVNFSSGWGRSTDAEVAPYCTTKWAIEGMSLAMAQEVPKGMAVIPLNPGVIDTEMLRSCFGSSAHNYPDPKKWAKKAVPFLLSLDARHNGQQLTVPG